VLAGGRVADVDVVALVYPWSGSHLHVRSGRPFGSGRPYRLDLLGLGLEAFASNADVRKLQADLTAWLSSSIAVASPTNVKSPPPVQP
jgi:hypothetical protein